MERESIFHNEVTELHGCLDMIKKNISNLHMEVQQMNNKVGKQFYDTRNGISFLGMKYQILLSYSSNLLFFLLLKSKGKRIRGHPVIKNLIEQRLILEHMKPISSKLHSTIRKLILISSRSLEDVIDVPNEEMEDEDEEEEEEEMGPPMNRRNIVDYNNILPPPPPLSSTGNMTFSPTSDNDPRFDDDNNTTPFLDEEIPSSEEEMEEDSQGSEIIGPPLPLDAQEKSRREKERKKLSERLLKSQLWREIQNIESGRPIERPIVGSESFMEFEEEDDDDVFEEMGIKGKMKEDKEKERTSVTGNFDREMNVLNRSMMDMKRVNQMIHEERKRGKKSNNVGISIDMDEMDDGNNNNNIFFPQKKNMRRSNGNDEGFGFGYDDDEEEMNDNEDEDDNNGAGGGTFKKSRNNNNNNNKEKRSRKRRKRNFRHRKGRSQKRRKY